MLNSTNAGAGSFECLARDPAGGFYVMVAEVGGGANPRLYHMSETATGAAGLTVVVTDPSLGEARLAQSPQGTPPDFSRCSLATSPDGTIFIQFGPQLWQVAAP
jgi:hypothetical protein